MAAGRSRRFGARDKLKANLNGRPLASHAISALASMPAAVRLVVAADPAIASSFPSMEVIEPAFPGAALGDNIARGVSEARRRGCDAALIHLADMPFVPVEHLVSLAAACNPNGTTATATSQNGRAQAPACFPLSWFDRLALLTGDQGASALLRQTDVRLVPLAALLLIDVDDPRTLAECERVMFPPEEAPGMP